MRFTATVAALAASTAVTSALSASDYKNIPQCAIPCLLPAISESGCDVSEQVCMCTTGRDTITKSLNSCIPNKCSAEDSAKIAPLLAGLCAKAGVTITDYATTTNASPKRTASATTTMGSASNATVTTSTPSFTGAANLKAVELGAVALGLAAFAGL